MANPLKQDEASKFSPIMDIIPVPETAVLELAWILMLEAFVAERTAQLWIRQFPEY